MTFRAVAELGRPLFSATKQVGFVLGTESGSALDWSQACDVLDRLNEASEEVGTAHLAALQNSEFANLAPQVRTAMSRVDMRLGERGHIYKSPAVHAEYHGYTVSLLLAYTICVVLPSPYDRTEEKRVQSKFWYSTIIEPRLVERNEAKEPDTDPRFEECCTIVEDLAPQVLKATLPLYEEAIESVNAAIGAITQNPHYHISDLCVQVDDPRFRSETARIQDGKAKIFGSDAHSIRLLAQLAYTPHLLQQWRSDTAINTRAFTQNDPHSAQALYVETTRRNPDAEGFVQRAIGVTNWAEPVLPVARAQNERFEALWRHRASHSLSNARVTAAVSRI